MLKCKALTTIVFLLASCSNHATPVKKQITEADINNLVSHLSHFCAGHITGAPHNGKPGPHINWNAFSSELSSKELIAKYEKKIHLPPNTTDKNCSSWTHKSETSEKVFEVCSIQSLGPWSNCAEIPLTAKSVVVSSSITR